MTQGSVSASSSDTAVSTNLQSSQWTPRRVIAATLVILGVALCFVLLWRFYAVVFSFIVAIMLQIAMKPAVDRMRQRGIRQEVGVLLVYLVVFVILAGFVALMVPFVAQQIATVIARLPEYYQDFRTALLNSGSPAFASLVASLPAEISVNLLAPPTVPQTSVAEAASPLQSVSPAAYAVFVFIAIFFIAFYWELEGDRIVYALLLRVRAERRDDIRELIADMESKVGAFYRGQLILCLSIGVLALIAYVIIGLPYALLLAILAFIFEAVPMIGPALGAIPAIIIALTVSPEKAIWVIVATIVMQQLENNLLVPRVMDKQVGVNAIVSIVAIAAFTVIFGLVGALLAIPLAAILQIILNRVLFDRQATAETAPDVSPLASEDLVGEIQTTGGRDRVSVLRMEARELAEDVRKQMRKRETADAIEQESVEDTIEAIALDLDAWLAERAADNDRDRNDKTAVPRQPELAS